MTASKETMKAGIANDTHYHGIARLPTEAHWDAACELRKGMWIEERRLLDIMCDWAGASNDEIAIAHSDLARVQCHRAILTRAIVRYEREVLGVPGLPADPPKKFST